MKGAPEVHNILDSHAPYLDITGRLNSELLQRLGVQSTVSLDAAIEALKGWSGQAEFETSLQHMTRVYEFLSWKVDSGTPADAAAVCSAFSDHELIWLPAKQQAAPNPGSFYGARDSLFYTDPTGVMEGTDASAMRCVQSYYASDMLQAFFCQQLLCTDTGVCQHRQGSGSEQQGPKLLVPTYAATADYISLLTCLATQHSDEAFLQAGQLLGYWSACFQLGQLYEVHLIQHEMRRHCLLPGWRPAEGNSWVALSDGVYLMDNEASAAHFADKPVSFLALPPSALPYGVR